MTIEQILKTMKLYTDDKRYVLLRLHTHAITVGASVIAELAEPFSSLIVGKDEVTLLIPADALETFASRLRDYRISEMQYRLITFDVTLDLSLVGFMARISQALAEVGVAIMPYAAYTRDHLLVPADQFDKAWSTLEKLTVGN